MSVKCILTGQERGTGGGGAALTLLSIEVTTPPTKTTYSSGETFDSTGMIVTASYGIGSAVISTSEVTGYTVSPNVLTDNVTQVTITYSEFGSVCTTTQSVVVNAKLQSISAADPTEEYEYGDTFPSTYPVTALYSNGSTQMVNANCSNVNLTAVGNHEISLSYETATTTLTIDVKRKKVAKPALKSAYSTNVGAYTGDQYDINNATYLDNYSDSYYTVIGNTSTNAGSFTMTCTLTSNYRWSDETITAIDIPWNIAKADRTITISPNNLEIDADNLTKTATASSSAGGGDWSISPNSITGLANLSIDNVGVITVTGDGSTDIASTTITITRAADTNYNSASNTIVIIATYNTWGWGDETAIGDANWWAGLANWLYETELSERQACVGKKKKVSLSRSILGADAASMLCIGADQDGDNTLTFQTEGVLPDSRSFGSNALWDGSTIQNICTNFGTYCSATNSIKAVTKLTSGSCNDNRNNPADVSTTDKCWLPSEQEMGLNANSPSRLECTEGTTNIGYSYYTDNDKRIKHTMDSNGILGTESSWYWDRSRVYGTSYSTSVCAVSGTGTAYTNGCTSTKGRLSPAFVIGAKAPWTNDMVPADSSDSATVGDADWWAGLKSWASTATVDERKALLGKCKKVSLSEPILGANQVIMQCVGYDIDGTGTLTFQAKNTLPTTTVFSSSNALYEGSTAESLCKQFGEKCSATNSIKSIQKKVCTLCNNSKTNAADKTLTAAKAWLPSECEMGLANNYSSSNAEWSVDGQQIAYQYYTNENSRIKYRSATDGSATSNSDWYWDRSRYYRTSSSGVVCAVINNGTARGSSYDGANGLAPAFTIG